MSSSLALTEPLYRDPIYDGATDPTVIWNKQHGEWWMFYTSRRANVDCADVAWVYGTDIGIASSTDGGRTWSYCGVAQGLSVEPGRNTFWAPEVIYHDDRYHMYVSYVKGVHSNWSNPKSILHYESVDMWNWTYRSTLDLKSDRTIDACVSRLDSGKWRMWYKDEAHGSHTYAVDSDDLYSWSAPEPVITDCPHEGPNVFQWHGHYWMITDPWKGLGVYTSLDAETWTRQNGNILWEPGKRVDDSSQAYHADVVVQGDEAFIFYFTHPCRSPDGVDTQDPSRVVPYKYRRSSIQVARLLIEDGSLICNRDDPFTLELMPPPRDSKHDAKSQAKF